MFPIWIKSGFRYGLSYLVVSVVCTILIVIGNDFLVDSVYRGNLCDTVLKLDYTQWLPVCALALAVAFVVYLLFARLLFRRFPLWLAALICGLISVGVALLTGIIPFSFWYYGWYETKNILTFFIAGQAFVFFSELMD